MELVNKVLQGYVNGELKDIAPSTKQDNVFLQNDTTKTIDYYIQYKVGDTITTADESFDPNTEIGGTWIKNIAYTKDVPFTQITPPEGVTLQHPSTTGYIVRNGICFLFMDGVRASAHGPIALGIPNAAIQVAQYTIDGQSVFVPVNAGFIQANGPINGYAITLSYPVLDIDVTKLYVWTKTA